MNPGHLARHVVAHARMRGGLRGIHRSACLGQGATCAPLLAAARRSRVHTACGDTQSGYGRCGVSVVGWKVHATSVSRLVLPSLALSCATGPYCIIRVLLLYAPPACDSCAAAAPCRTTHTHASPTSAAPRRLRWRLRTSATNTQRPQPCSCWPTWSARRRPPWRLGSCSADHARRRW